jgi:hypothetical protein
MKKIFLILAAAVVLSSVAFATEKQHKKLFILTQEHMPPFSADRRLTTKGEYEQEIVFLFSNKSNKKDFIPVIYTKAKYKQLYIRALDIVYNEKPTILMLDAEFELPENAYSLGSDEEAWITDGEFYWLNGYFAYPKNGKHWAGHWPVNVDFERIFKDKLYASESFACQIELWYHFDDEPEKHIILDYTVEPREVNEEQRKRMGW